MTNEGLDPRYPDYRDHAALKERVTKLEASLMHLPTDVAELRRKQDQIFAKLDSLGEKMDGMKTPPVDHGALVMQRAMDIFDKKASPNYASPSILERLISIVGAMAIGAFLWKLVAGAL